VATGRLVALEGWEPDGVQARSERDHAGRCALRAALTDDIALTCKLERPGWVVVNASHHPHWTAQIGSDPSPILRANAMVMAIRAPAGTHEVTFRYREPSLRIGLLAALLVFALCVTLLVRQARSNG
jgi:uncharacterized membrane protein YfhO